MKKFNIKSLLASAMIAATICTTTCAAPASASASIHLDFWNKYYKDVRVTWEQYGVNGTAIDYFYVQAYNDDYFWEGDITGSYLREMLGVKSVNYYGAKTKDIKADYLDDTSAFPTRWIIM